MPKHQEIRTLPFSAPQLFALVADVESYPEFLPWCISALVREKTPKGVVADLTIGYKAFRESFTSNVTLDKPRRISVEYVSGPLSRLSNEWGFEAVKGGCRLSFEVDFAFRSRLLGAMMEVFFESSFRRMVGAFEDRARELYLKG